MSGTSSQQPGSTLLRGHMHNLRATRQRHDFVFTAADRAKMGATAVVAGLAGLGGIATGLSGTAMDTTDVADLLEFDLDGESVKAWVWVSVFREGDEVEVVAERQGDIWQGYGIRRVADSIVALHPHCSRGRYAHYKASARWWAGITAILYVFSSLVMILMSIRDGYDEIISMLKFLLICAPPVFFIFGFIAFGISRRLMGFVKLAEGIFDGFGWGNVKNIDLPAITRKGKRPGEPGALGVMYFRYPGDGVDLER